MMNVAQDALYEKCSLATFNMMPLGCLPKDYFFPPLFLFLSKK